ncbi:MAG: PQQ-dependent sugar dehydrogenase [Rhodoferax sp.]|nr:PQQ-dependent sugar dehydrogenase [Rhodoferax sp.]
MNFFRRPVFASLVLAAAVVSAAFPLAAADVAPSGTNPAAAVPLLNRSVVLSGLSGPWDIAFAPDGTMFFTEKCRGLSARRGDGSITRLFGTSGSALLAPDLVCQGQSGVHGVAVDPQFASNRTLYLYMASTLQANARTNRVLRLQLDEALATVVSRTDIVTDIVFKHQGNAHGTAGAHSGGRLRFGPDGFLYVATGDTHSGAVPQSPTLLGGKVLRVTRDGAPAPANNAPAGFDARIFTYGHRNVQGIDFRPGSGQPFIAEHGPNHNDEVTRLVAGGNGGWDPQNRPQLNCADGYCGYAGNASTMPMTDRARFPNALRPSWTNNGASEGLSPLTFLMGARWLGWNGRLAVGMLAGQRVEVLALDADGNTGSTVRAGLPAARYRALTQGPDGDLYIATDAGEIWRVTPSAAPARP